MSVLMMLTRIRLVPMSVMTARSLLNHRAFVYLLASAKDVTFRPAGNQEEWNGWTESAFAASFVDGHLPAAGDVVTLSAEGHAVLPRHLKFLCMNWPANVGAGLGGAGFGLVGDATWVHEVRNLFVDEKAYSFLSSPHFFGWWRFCRADTVTFAPAGTDTTAVVQRLEAIPALHGDADTRQFGLGLGLQAALMPAPHGGAHQGHQKDDHHAHDQPVVAHDELQQRCAFRAHLSLEVIEQGRRFRGILRSDRIHFFQCSLQKLRPRSPELSRCGLFM